MVKYPERSKYPVEMLYRVLRDPLFASKKLVRLAVHRFNDELRIVTNHRNSNDIVNKKEIRVLGLRRTGNHAIINWIENQQSGCTFHLNNAPINENPYQFIYEYVCDNYPRYQTAIKHALSYPQYKEDGAEGIKKEAGGDFVKKDCLICSYEDQSLRRFSNNRARKMHDIYFGKSGESFDVLILRDPFNWLASRFKKQYMSVKIWDLNIVDLWIEYAKEFLGETQFLNGRRKVFINYNQWVLSKDYRQEIAKNLDLEFTDAGIDEVGRFGGGSSFDQKKFSGQASEMKVFDRWKAFSDNEAYLSLLNNKELLEYSKQIFGDIQGTDSLLKKVIS